MKKVFVIDEALAWGWENTKKRIWFLIVALVISQLLPMIPNQMIRLIPKTTPLNYGTALNIALTVISLILSFVLWVGLVKIFLNIYDQKKYEYADLYRHYKLAWKYFLTSFLLGLLVLAGILLLIFPGIIWSMKYQFAPYIIIDKDTGIIEAFRKSSRITKGNIWGLIGFSIVIDLVIFIGLIAFLVGILWAYPTALLATVFVYRKLSNNIKPVQST